MKTTSQPRFFHLGPPSQEPQHAAGLLLAEWPHVGKPAGKMPATRWFPAPTRSFFRAEGFLAVAVILFALLLRASAQTNLPVLPVAEGFSARADGGRVGDVHHVVNLASRGAGSIANGIAPHTTEPLNLAGQWRFALDRADGGVPERWFAKDLPDKINLPGVLQAQGFGDEISTTTPWVLSLYDRLWYLRADYAAYTNAGHVKVPFVCQPPRHYLGAAWYQRDIEIPPNWIGRRVELFLERARWETRAWLDERPLGTNNSLCTPHVFEAGVVGTEPNQIKPGKHRLTVRCDNRMLMPYRPDAHAVSDSLNSTWNGIVGKIELRSTPLVWIEDAQVFPDIKSNLVTVKLRLGNRTGKDASVSLQTILMLQNPALNDFNRPGEVTVPASGCDLVRYHVLSPRAALWDEFRPGKESIFISLDCGGVIEKTSVSFGLRDFRAVGQDFVINDRPTHLRGTHHGGDFPLTGYPPCDVEYWRKLFQTCKEWGLNHVRFHSFCPPEAAFTAADEIGIYLQIEPGMWNDISPGTPMEAMLYAETERILKAYGNHPSFVLFSASNEAKGRWKEALPKWVKHFRELDPRHLYTPDTGWSLIDAPGPVDGADFLAVHRIGGNMLRGDKAWFGGDYGRSLRGVNVPVVSHELGQWCAYPDFDVIRKFTDYMRPGNYEIFRDSAAAHGVLEQNKEFFVFSKLLQFECYKEEIEANLRTPGLAGFQLLDLHDYVGQGTALVGLLDPFWEPGEDGIPRDVWRGFCNSTVPLARLNRRVFTKADSFEVPVEIAHYGPSPLTNATVAWELRAASGYPVRQGVWPPSNIPLGNGFVVGTITNDLSNLPAPAVFELVVAIGQRPNPLSYETQAEASSFKNSWSFYLYPSRTSTNIPSNILVTSSWPVAEARLAAGERVLFIPRTADFGWDSTPLDRVPIFWNRLMNPSWSRFLGLVRTPNHPALERFPDAPVSNWQWTELTRGARAINLDRAPRELQPVVQAIDDWNRNWKLGCIFEARVGSGRLLVCSFDLKRDLENRPVAAALRLSLLTYMTGEGFRPQVTLTPEQARDLWFDTRVMTKLGATAQAAGNSAGAVLDGDPNTFWSVGGSGRGGDGRRHPHELTITFTNAVAMNGVVLMNRQNDRDHLGDIRGYTLAVSDDGQAWREVLKGELASTWNPQTVKFPAPSPPKP